MKIKSCFKEYSLLFQSGFDFMEELFSKKNAFYAVDRYLYSLYANTAFKNLPKENVMLIDALEDQKTVETALELCERMISIPAKRNAVLISFGGGIVQDITGFAASVLYRGVGWIFVPTTLLAACDSCIGGKSSLNFKSYKNLLGSFYPPGEIYICPDFFPTLSERDYLSGLGEVVKFNILTGTKGMSRIEKDLDQLLARNPKAVEEYTKTSLSFKKHFIEEDEFDYGERIKLNYGHTFGHAIETVTGYEIPHGTAVAIGSIMANEISRARGILDSKQAERMESLLLPIIKIGDGTDLGFDTSAVVAAMKNDKKRRGIGLTDVLLDRDYNLELVHDLTEDEVTSAVAHAAQIIRNK